MADETGKGSIILKLIIVILIVVLIGAIMIPKQMWDQEERNTEICHQRMSSLLAGELLYQKFNEHYCPSLDTLLRFFSDSLDKYQLEFVELDTILGVQLMELIKEDSLVLAIIDTITADTTLSDVLQTISIDYFLSGAMVKVVKRYDAEMTRIINPVLEENIEDKMAPSKAIAKLAEVKLPIDILNVFKKHDSLYTVIKQLKPTLAMEHFLPNIKQNPELSARVDSFYSCYLDSLYHCPTVQRQYKIAVVGSTIVFSHIYCPVDSTDSLAVENDWWRKNVGGITLKNHGNIESGEKSWEKIQ